jgi:transcriptional regulator with XRE-family HTH domain
MSDIVNVNWGKIAEKISEKGWNKRTFSQMLGLNQSYISNGISKNATLEKSRIEQMALILGCEPKTLILSEEKPAEQVSQEGLPASQFETDVLRMLEEIQSKLRGQHEILTYLFNEKQQEHKQEEPKEGELEISMRVLKGLLEGRMAVKYEEFMTAVDKEGVKNRKVAAAAISKLGFFKSTTGYGQNKTLWIQKNAPEVKG